jgi:indolepyruvate ferredoxin oxidoreductase beta subunit
MSTRPIRISINALGGQGGGVLADWLVSVAEHAGWRVQATSVAGVAQRTGATVYYLEMAPEDPAGRDPIFALMPVPGDIDVVVASELMEAGRAIARGIVTPDRTALIASTHRIYAIGEKTALGDGRAGASAVLEAARVSARSLTLADFQALAEANGSVISATLLGAIAASAALPFPRQAFEDAIRRGGVGVESSLKAFDAAFATAEALARGASPAPAVEQPVALKIAPLERISALHASARDLALIGVDRAIDYQDRRYGLLYLDRLEKVAAADDALGGQARDFALTREAARRLALWMTYEDVVRVADLKTRASRFERFRREVRAADGQIVHVTEFMHPRWQELCDTLPRGLGAALARSKGLRGLVERWIDRDRQVSTSRLGGFLMLWGLARLRGLRPGSLRFCVEQQRIEAWLQAAVDAARIDYDLAVEILRLQRLVKGYGDTHARGLAKFELVLTAAHELAGQPGAAARVAALHEAALKDEEGQALQAALGAPALAAA